MQTVEKLLLDGFTNWLLSAWLSLISEIAN